MPNVTINMGFCQSRIESGTLDPETTNAISEACSFMPAGGEHMARSNKYKGKWDGTKRLYHKGHRTFGTGLLDRISKILLSRGYSVHVTGSTQPHHVREEMPDMPEAWSNVRDYQASTIDTMVAELRGMVKVATGGGKTVIAGHLMHRLGVETVFFVHTKDLLYQALETFRSMFGEATVGQVGDGVCDPRFITVCTLQTAARALGVDYSVDSYAEGDESWRDKSTDTAGVRTMLHYARLVIMDECHRVAAPSATEVMMNTPSAPWRYGLSASPWRDDGADLSLEAVFGRVIVDVNASSLIQEAHLVRPIIRFKRVPPARFDKKATYSTVYSEYIVSNADRNELVVEEAASKVRRGLSTLVLVREIGHGVSLREALAKRIGVDVPFISGTDGSATRADVLRDVREGRLGCFIASTIADEGLDIKPLRALVLAGAGKSSTRALQRVGRVLRPFAGKTHAEVTDFEDNAKFVLNHSRARMKIYESEPEFQIVDY